MVKNEEYLSFLKSLVACVSHGDYYSIKELSNLKLEDWKEKENNIKKEITKIKNYKPKNKSIEELENKDLLNLMNLYSYYIQEKIKEEILSFEEFTERIIK